MDFEKPGVVSVWLGRFASRTAFGAYLEERYEAEGDATPLNRFAADFRLGVPPRYFYDHDFQEAEFRASGPAPIGDLLAPFSGAGSFLSAAAAAARAAGVSEANAAILLYDFHYDPAVSPVAPAGPVRFLGAFPYMRPSIP
jgi:hypothetical protein